MTKQNYSFRLSVEKIKKLDDIGKQDERDRTFMVNKAIDLFLRVHSEKNGTTLPKKKAGTR